MKRIAQITITILAFILSMIGIEFMIGAIAGDNPIYLASLGNFPGHMTETTYLDRYIGFMIDDTLGWFSYTMLGAAQDLEILASNVFVTQFNTLSYLPDISLSIYVQPWSPFGLIPIMFEAHPASSVPEYFLPAMLWMIKLVVPFVVTGIVAGLVAKEKKQAIGNTLIAFLVVGLAGAALNLIHVYMNIESLNWKFTAMATVNPAFTQFLYLHSMEASLSYYTSLFTSSPITLQAAFTLEMGGFMIETTIVTMIFALVNGLILSIISVIVARKK